MEGATRHSLTSIRTSARRRVTMWGFYESNLCSYLVSEDRRDELLELVPRDGATARPFLM
jgi:hypothetical protein